MSAMRLRRSGFRDDDEPLTLAEPGARRALRRGRDSLEDLALDRPIGVVIADHATTTNDLVELHSSRLAIRLVSACSTGWT